MDDPNLAFRVPSAGDEPVVSPLVRRLAEEFGVDLDTTKGTGPEGRVTRADVQRAAFGTVIGERVDHAAPPRSAPVTGEPAGLAEPEPGRSLTLFRAVEVEQLLRAHERLNATIDGGLPLEALLMRLALPVLVEHPRMNARVDDTQGLVPADHYDMAFTCVSDTGMAVPVVRQVNDRSLRALSRAVGELAARAGRGHLALGESGRQTFTVHNLGPLGVTAGTTSLPAGTAALVSYGRPRPSLQLVAGSPREVPVMTVAVTVNHRLIHDGEAARFLAEIGRYLEEPILAFTD